MVGHVSQFFFRAGSRKYFSKILGESLYAPYSLGTLSKCATSSLCYQKLAASCNENNDQSVSTLNGNTEETVDASLADHSVQKTDCTGKKILRKKFAILLSYKGANYHGMQYQPHCDTVEGRLFDAFILAGFGTSQQINRINFDLAYHRASRTDAGVSAIQQLCTMMLPVGTRVEDINKYLPDDIRVFDIRRTTRGCNAQKWCSARTYSYLLPTYAFVPYKSQPDCLEDYRIDADTIYKVVDLFNFFKGSHKFHNYTRKKEMEDPSSWRFMREFSCSQPYLVQNLEVIEIFIQGNSFMLYQIRKMVGTVIAVMRGRATSDFIRDTFVMNQLHTPTAPSSGLMLEKVHYDHYNMRFDHVEPLEFPGSLTENFKYGVVVPHIVDSELEEGIMKVFLEEELRRHQFHK